MAVHPVAFAVRHTGIRHRLSKAHIKRVHHTVSGVQPTERLQNDLVDGTGCLAVYRRTGDTLTGQSQATPQQKRHCRAIM